MQFAFVFVILAVCLATGFSQRNILKETTCQTHQKNSNKGLVTWDIKCDSQGKYLPLQCTNQTPKWCACYNKEESITQPSRKTKSCECYAAKAEAESRGAKGCQVPQCETSGKFAKKQSCVATGKYHCVHPDTGIITTQPTSNPNLTC